MKTDNELIAEFMGLTANPHDGGRTWAREVTVIDGAFFGDRWETLRYDTSWDWLMPVFEKIQAIEYEPKDGADSYNWNIPYIRTLGNNMCRINRMPLFQGDTLIEAVYASVVEFITWYNQNKQS